MNGRVRKFNQQKYRESCKNTGEPVAVDSSIKFRLQDMIAYAKRKRVSLNDLTSEEKMMFVTRL